MLSPYSAISCAYTPLVKQFGARLRALRKRIQPNGMELARMVLGEKAGTEKLRDYANYLSRVERGDVENVGLEWLTDLANVLTHGSLSEFFLQLEQAKDLRDSSLTEKGGQDKSVKTRTGTPFNAPSDPVSAASTEQLVREQVAQALVMAGSRLKGPIDVAAGAPEQTRRSDSTVVSASRKKPAGRKRGAGNR